MSKTITHEAYIKSPRGTWGKNRSIHRKRAAGNDLITKGLHKTKRAHMQHSKDKLRTNEIYLDLVNGLEHLLNDGLCTKRICQIDDSDIEILNYLFGRVEFLGRCLLARCLQLVPSAAFASWHGTRCCHNTNSSRSQLGSQCCIKRLRRPLQFSQYAERSPHT